MNEWQGVERGLKIFARLAMGQLTVVTPVVSKHLHHLLHRSCYLIYSKQKLGFDRKTATRSLSTSAIHVQKTS